MPKGPTLTRAERDEITTLRASNLSARDIATRIDRSKTVVLNYLKNPTKYGTVKRSGRKRALTKAQEEQIFHALSTGGGGAGGGAGGGGGAKETLSAERIKQEFALPLSTRRVQQLLSDWRRSKRKALDQQHALTEDRQEEEEEEEQKDEEAETLNVPPPSTMSVQKEDEANDLLAPPPSSIQEKDVDHGLLKAIPPPPSLMQEDGGEEDDGDASLAMDPSAPTQEAQV